MELEINKIGNRPSGKVNVKIIWFKGQFSNKLYGRETKINYSSTDSNVPIAGLPAITIGRGGDGGKKSLFR